MTNTEQLVKPTNKIAALVFSAGIFLSILSAFPSATRIAQAAAPVLSVDRNRLYFNTTTVGIDPASQNVSLVIAGTGALNWTAMPNSSGWLSLSPVSGNGSATITVTVTAASLPVGTYAGTVTISCAEAINSLVVLPITFRVGQTVTKPYTISTVAGMNVMVEGGPAINQPLSVNSVAVDSSGNMYVADPGKNKIYVVSQSGAVNTFAGTGQAGFGGDGGPALSAQFYSANYVAVDYNDNVYVSDYYRIRKIAASTRIITTVVGGVGQGFSGDGGPATLARIDSPQSITFDSMGNLYFADYLNQRIRKVSRNGTITTIAGTGTASSNVTGNGGPATSANLYFPQSIAADSYGNIYLVHYSSIRLVNTAGVINTIAGSSTGSCPGTGNGGPASTSVLCFPQGVAVDTAGNIYISERYDVRMVNTAGVISSFAGTGDEGSSGDGGLATLATFRDTFGLVLHSKGDVAIVDRFSRRVRKVTAASRIIQTVVGGGSPGFNGDGGAATSTQFDGPEGIAVDLNGALYIADRNNHRIRKVSSNGIVTTVAGIGTPGFSGDGSLATAAQLNSPMDVAVDTTGNIFIQDYGNHRIRKVDATGTISTLAGNGSGTFSGDGGPATLAGISPRKLIVDVNGNVYFSDTSSRVRKITVDGIVNTIAGNGTSGTSGNGGPATSAQLFIPQALALDGMGNLYIGSTPGPWGGTEIRRIDVNGIISSLSIAPSSLAVDPADRLVWSLICGVSAQSTSPYTTISPQKCGAFGDGGPAMAASVDVRGLAIDTTGNIFATDVVNGLVRKLTPIEDGSFALSTNPTGAFVVASDPVPFSLTVRLEGTGTATWTATKSNSNWMTLSTTTGTTGTSFLDVTVNAAGLAGGFYPGNITISSLQAVNGSVLVPLNLQVNYASPTLASINPTTAMAGSTAVEMVINGTSFVPGAMVQFGGTILNPTFITAAQLNVIVPDNNLAAPGSYPVTVFNPSPGGGVTAEIVFTVTVNPALKKRPTQVTSQ